MSLEKQASMGEYLSRKELTETEKSLLTNDETRGELGVSDSALLLELNPSKHIEPLCGNNTSDSTPTRKHSC